MSAVPAAVKAFQIINLGFELMSAGQQIASRMVALQQKRLAEGAALTSEEVDTLMDTGDAQALIEKAKLLAAQLAQRAS